MAQKGGFASAKKRQEKRTYKEIAAALLPEKPSQGGIDYVLSKFPYINTQEITVKMMMVLGLASRAMLGDLAAFNKMQELAPDTPDNDALSERPDLQDLNVVCELCGYPPPYKAQIEMADFVFDAANEPRLLLGARRYGKSEYSVILKAAQEIALNKTRILLIIRDKERAKDFALEIARCVKALGISDFSRINSSVIQLASNTTKEPNLSAVVLGSKGIRSRHPDIVILDDPITPETASPADKKKAKRVYDEVLKLTQRVRIIGQPVSKADLYDITRQKIKTLEMPHGSIPELDTDLELLRLAGVDEASINASYFLKLTDVGKMPFSDIEIIDVSFDKAKGAIASIDPSHEGGDFTAISICQGHFDKLLIAGFCFKAAWYDCINELSALFAKYNVSICFFENNALGEEPIRQLKKIAPAVRVSGFKSLDNKEAKIQNAGMFAKEIIVSKESNTEYIEQLKNYEAGIEHDDAPDSLANLFINLRLQKSAKEKRLF